MNKPPPEWLEVGGRQVAWRPPAFEPMPKTRYSAFRIGWRVVLAYIVGATVFIILSVTVRTWFAGAGMAFAAGWLLGQWLRFDISKRQANLLARHTAALDQWSAHEEVKTAEYVLRHHRNLRNRPELLGHEPVPPSEGDQP
jgi:hypothetical protein